MTKPSEYDSGIRVEQIRGSRNPDRLVAQCARGDYYDGYVGDAEFQELIDPVTYDERHAEAVSEILDVPVVDELWFVNEAKTYRLLEKLFRRGHWGAFEHPQITLAVKGASRSCMAQVTRHRPITFDVQSQRYVDFAEKDDPVKIPKSFLDEEHVTRDEGIIDVDDEERERIQSEYDELVEHALEFYEECVEVGFPKEDARFALPIGTNVNWTMSMNARTLLHLENVRGKGNAQWEAQELAAKVLEAFDEWMPYTAHLWEQHGDMPLAP